MSLPPVAVGLNAVVMAAGEEAPQVLVVSRKGESPALPFGPFDPARHRTFEIGLREWVNEQARFQLGYVEQLYTFGDQGREAPLADLPASDEARIISVGYLALTPEAAELPSGGGDWQSWYSFFPWEDWRQGKPAIVSEMIEPALRRWIDEAETEGRRDSRRDRARIVFGLDGRGWNEERCLDRYELLYSAGLIAEAARDRGDAPPEAVPGRTMASDHRRIMATAISRLRGKIKYRPVVFELMPETFTLSHLQKIVEGIVGFSLHKQNFRRALDRTGFVEGTGKMLAQTGGRPAELFRYRREALREAQAAGISTPRSK
ncbi:NAD regulator [Hyphobacterium sp. HN65]|uniref:NAD regulator n=1 Tax=Hyphobacterium lacteum TaxID=3116575 RepID=A0ABU7LNR8_9PROT|nr:NAD regulator [Hyphobacterium sp. HN65]MEE2525256.1 NAD regulator [Hyphobacterium sp. HN65]